ncbi:MAG: hypothetical protein ABEN55_08985 [Bradymonadaceae bacterium]
MAHRMIIAGFVAVALMLGGCSGEDPNPTDTGMTGGETCDAVSPDDSCTDGETSQCLWCIACPQLNRPTCRDGSWKCNGGKGPFTSSTAIGCPGDAGDRWGDTDF